MPALLMVAHFDASGQPLRQLEKPVDAQPAGHEPEQQGADDTGYGTGNDLEGCVGKPEHGKSNPCAGGENDVRNEDLQRPLSH